MLRETSGPRVADGLWATRAAQGLRRSTTTNAFIANGNVGGFANLINNNQTLAPAPNNGKPGGLLLNAGLQIPFLYAGDDGSLASLAEERSEKAAVYGLTAFAADGGTPAGQEFCKRFKDRFGQNPDVNAVLAYDTARLLFEGMNQANAAEPVQVRKALAHLESFDTLTGPLLFGKERQVRRPVWVVRRENGTTQVVKRYEPEK